MYKSNLSKEQEAARSKKETVEEFLARGGQIQRVSTSKKTKKIDAQELLNKATACGQEREMIAFLKSQGITVE